MIEKVPAVLATLAGGTATDGDSGLRTEGSKELQGAVRIGKERHKGKILLETSELIFRGTDYRLKITFGEMRDVQAKNGELHIATKDGVSVFEVGTHAEKWRDKILHPKSRTEKLGVKAGTTVSLLGEFEADFVKELRAAKVQIT